MEHRRCGYSRRGPLAVEPLARRLTTRPRRYFRTGLDKLDKDSLYDSGSLVEIRKVALRFKFI
ncbi:hypothetical protein GSH08_31095 [Burkholderia pseudomallei]|nr:hypothetical protein [Burkholderia pseudomallei]MBM5588437.1 hypothetical protein [Burkholderia pseudomallei]RPA02217.1 hypothetical protein EGT86_25495 [Burkholderia pseudomallei]